MHLGIMAQSSNNQSSALGALKLPEGALMASTNFEFLRKFSSPLVDFAGYSEQHWSSHPNGAAVQLRSFISLLVGSIYDIKRFPRPERANLNDLLHEHVFRQATPRVVLDRFHLVRKLGNRGAHPEDYPNRPVRPEEVLAGLRDAFSLAQWAFLMHFGGSQAACPQVFQEPPPESTKGKLKRDKKELLEAQRLLEAQLKQALDTIEQDRKHAAGAEAAGDAEHRAPVPTEEERATIQAEGQIIATDVLGWNEAETRKRLIDEDLVAAGWDIRDKDQVGQEVPVSGLPQGFGTGGKSGNGKVDYVLWGDDGKPLAVVEAKRTSKDAEEGRTQARLYADVLEKKHGQRPVIFYTNGPEIFIWDDAAHGDARPGYPPRKVYGYYSKASLQTLIFRRTEKADLAAALYNPKIIDRLYQVEAVKRVTERFTDNHRRVLVVQATGTGKTRVAVALCDMLSKAKWAKRVLFLCDRRELRKQALTAFKDHLPTEPRTAVSKESKTDNKSRIFVGTYPGMIGIYESFDVGFFDLIIADESHRSIYNKYRDLFDYFDCLQVGLTATPVKFVERNTYKLFKCEDKDPTFNYEYEDAVKDRHLAPFEVMRVTTKFLREGIRYEGLSDEEKRDLEEQLAKAEDVDFEPSQIDKQVFNKDTTRHILNNLMEDGIRDASGSLPGKTIVFARSHEHGKHLAEVFAEMFPQLGGGFARLIDSKEPNAETLIDEFKDPKNILTVAISVDMLDTGIDVPEVVNLVFAKPVKSYVKFWQMIGRGTRLRENLYGPGQHKESFRIFDHWENFKYFDEEYQEKEPPAAQSLQQRLLSARVELLEAAIQAMDEGLKDSTARLLLGQLNALRETGAITVREHWKELELLASLDTLKALNAVTRSNLLTVAGPLMRLVTIRGEEAAYQFDLLATRLQTAQLLKTPAFDDLKAEVEEHVEALPKNLNQVVAKRESVARVRSPEFWKDVTPSQVEELRQDLRGVMKHCERPELSLAGKPQVFDFRDGARLTEAYQTKLKGLNLVQYRNRVKKTLEEHFQEHLVYRKIRSNIRVSDSDLEKLAQLVLDVDSGADLHRLVAAEEERFRGQLYFALKSVVGLDRKAVDDTFKQFLTEFPSLTARQITFLSLIKGHICQHGLISLADLDEGQFLQFESSGLEGVFPDESMVTRLLDIISTFDPENVESERSA